MSTTYGSATERQDARPQLLVRTSQFLKVSTLRIIRRKSDKGDSRILGDAAYQRSARSMDLGTKTLAKVEVRAHHHSFDHGGDSSDESPCHFVLRSESRVDHASPTETSPLTSSPRRIDGLPLSVDPVPHPITQAHDTAIPRSMHTRAQTLPSRNCPGEDAPNGRTSISTTFGPSTGRALAPRLATLPPPMMAQYTAGGSARLTPSLVTRQPPMPILNLPTLPPPSPSQPNRQARPMAPLRSLPALLMQGPSGSDQDADHENTSLEDEDEEDEGDENTEEAGQGAGSDDSGDEDEESPPPEPTSVAGPSRLPLLPDVGITGFSVSFESAGVQSSTPGVHPQARPSVDYFTSKPPDPSFSPMRTPRGSDFRPNGKARATEPVPQPRILPMPATPGSPRPGLYHQVSKSMVDLTSIMRKDKIVSPKLDRTASKKSKPQGLAITVENQEPPPTTEPPDDVITSPMLRRRRSLPVYEPSSDPPPYPDPVFRWKGLPAYQSREDEGRETLPPYSNSIYLTGAMPRKMEFSQHGVQAKDRKWRRVYCVLEGTALRVYKCPPAASGVSVIERWWENTVGVGDITSVNVTAVTSTGIRVSAIREREGKPENARIPKIVEESVSGQESTPRPDTNEQPRSRSPSLAPPSTKSVLGLTSRFLRRQRSKSAIRSSTNSEAPTSRLSMDSRQENTRNPSATAARHSMDTLGSSRPCNTSSSISNTTSSTSLTVPSPPNSASSTTSNDSPSRFSRSRLLSHSHSHPHSSAGADKKDKEKDKDTPYTPDPKDLIRQYSLQHAESGLASDYQKRKNVIRVRVEGEQFLLQAKDVAAVIDWIEGIQMGTNISLDLDERPMPRGPIFPRRRRRRPRRVDANGTTQPSGA